ncbi:MAG: nucleotide exchange factor GrpE [Firmicutes bacterium]|nr:nucleotide exchange factor GrpE [Bacillota bacterium]
MNHPFRPSSLDPDDDFLPPAENTVDLTLEGLEGVDDLQALADEVAEITPDPRHRSMAPVPRSVEEVSDPVFQELEQEMQETTRKLIDAEKREAEQIEKHHRLLADFANYRNRTTRDIQLAVDNSERKLLLDLLPVLDNFERCISATYPTVDDFRNGVGLIHKQFLDTLKRMGVERLETQVGETFDAQFAEALTTTADPNLPDGAIASIFERGYLLRNQLLRPARVVVNHAPDAHLS